MAAAALRALVFEERATGAVEPRVEQGMWVKVGLREERFWCKVLQKRLNGALLVTVENHLKLSSLRLGEQVVLQRCHVLETADLQEFLVFSQLTGVLGLQGGAGLWRDSRVMEGVGVTPKQNSVFVSPAL